MDSFILALQFLTRLPVNLKIDIKEDSFAKSVAYFPIVGLIIGLLNALVYIISSYISDGAFSILCAILSNICFTGALHLDGLADTCDGIYSSRKREKMLEIMKDSRIGTNGTIAIVFDIAFRTAILLSVPRQSVTLILVLMPIASKTILPLIMKLSVYARAEGGMGQFFIGKQTWGRTLAAILAGGTLHYLGLGIIGLVIVTITAVIGLLFRVYIYSKLQGMTGDTLGAASEVMEIMHLLIFASYWRYLAL